MGGYVTKKESHPNDKIIREKLEFIYTTYYSDRRLVELEKLLETCDKESKYYELIENCIISEKIRPRY
jgi:hypothetical protein